MTDRISVRDLKVQAHVGVGDEERARPQGLTVHLDIEADLVGAGRSDDLADTVDYAAVTVAVAELVRSSEARLLEHLAELVAARVLDNVRVKAVTVEIIKDEPPIPEEVGDVAVRIRRERA